MGPNTTLNVDLLLGPDHEAREGSTMERYVVDGREAASGMDGTVRGGRSEHLCPRGLDLNH
ncbi:hypothetical protein BRD56_05910 [Thermoplasmatales archaeon SW_10_69_26]|nr:MAG: hypothetical protein BRD56_05910 [Thermoplasmatales archaeon SW_10_69_26]